MSFTPKILYEMYDCSVCSKPSIGAFYDPVDGEFRPKYYCNSHYWARSKREDAIQKAQEDKQWWRIVTGKQIGRAHV